MGALIARITGRPRLQHARLKTVWNYISKHDEYFLKVLRNVCKRDETIAAILMSEKYAVGEAEKEFILLRLAERMYEFVQLLMQDENLFNISEIKCTCYCLGKQHAAYTTESFKVVYWDEFTLAMMEELENSSRLENEDLRAWQSFLHLIVENMLSGYDHAKNTQIEK